MNLTRRNNGIWMLDAEIDGVRVRKTLSTRDHGEARRKAASTFETAKRDLDWSVNQLFDRCLETCWSPENYRSQATLLSDVAHMRTVCGQETVEDMTYQRLVEIRDELFLGRTKPLAPATVVRKLNLIGKALTEGMKHTGANGRPVVTARPPMPEISVNNVNDRVISDEEEAEIMASIHRRTNDVIWLRFSHLVRFLLDTACRRGEALALTRDDIEYRADGSIWMHIARYGTKSEKPKTLPLTDACRDMLPWLFANAEDGRLFPLEGYEVNRLWNMIRDELDLPDVVIQTFRHTCLTRLAKTIAIQKVSRWASHSNIATTNNRYAHLTPDDLKDALTVLNRSPVLAP